MKGSRAHAHQAVVKSRQGWSSDLGVNGIPTTRLIVLCLPFKNSTLCPPNIFSRSVQLSEQRTVILLC